MENLQKEKVSNVIKEWMEKQVILKGNTKNKELLKSGEFIIFIL